MKQLTIILISSILSGCLYVYHIKYAIQGNYEISGLCLLMSLVGVFTAMMYRFGVYKE